MASMFINAKSWCSFHVRYKVMKFINIFLTSNIYVSQYSKQQLSSDCVCVYTYYMYIYNILISYLISGLEANLLVTCLRQVAIVTYHLPCMKMKMYLKMYLPWLHFITIFFMIFITCLEQVLIQYCLPPHQNNPPRAIDQPLILSRALFFSFEVTITVNVLLI